MVLRAHSLFAAAFVLDRGLFAFLYMIIGYCYGVSAEADLYFISTFLPIMIANILAEISFVTLSKTLSIYRDERLKWAVTGEILKKSIYLLVVFTVVIELCSTSIIDFIMAKDNIEMRAIAESYFEISVLQIIPLGTSIMGSTILLNNGNSITGIFRGAIYTAVNIIVSLLLYFFYQKSILSFILGGAISALITALIIIICINKCKKKNHLFNKKINVNINYYEIFKSASANFILNLSHNLILIFERVIAAKYATGVISLISYSRTIVSLLGGMQNAIANSYFIKNIELAYSDRIKKVAPLVNESTGFILFISIPLFVIFFYCIDSIVSILYLRGKFDFNNIEIVKYYSLIFALGFLHITLGGVIQKIYLLLHMERSLLVISYFFIGVYFCGCQFLVEFLGSYGLVVSYSMALSMGTITLYLYIWLKNNKFTLDFGLKNDFLLIIVISLVLLISNKYLREMDNNYLSLTVVSMVVFITFLSTSNLIKIKYIKFLKD